MVPSIQGVGVLNEPPLSVHSFRTCIVPSMDVAARGGTCSLSSHAQHHETCSQHIVSATWIALAFDTRSQDRILFVAGWNRYHSSLLLGFADIATLSERHIPPVQRMSQCPFPVETSWS
jgi:hypothetical protein